MTTDTPAAELKKLAAEALKACDSYDTGYWLHEFDRTCSVIDAHEETEHDTAQHNHAMFNLAMAFDECNVPQLARAVQVMAEALEKIEAAPVGNIDAKLARTALTRAAEREATT